MRRNVSLAVLATISALTAVGSISPAAAEAIQDRYCLQGRNGAIPAIASSPTTPNAWPPRAVLTPIAESILNTRSRASGPL
jgi:hypothetical protein